MSKIEENEYIAALRASGEDSEIKEREKLSY